MDRDRFRSATGQGRTPSTDGVAHGRPMRAAPYVAPTRPPAQAPISQPAPVSRQPIAPNPVSPHQPQPVMRQQPAQQPIQQPIQQQPPQYQVAQQQPVTPLAQSMGNVAVQEPLFEHMDPGQPLFEAKPKRQLKVPSIKMPSVNMPSIRLPKPVLISVIAIVSLAVISGGAFAIFGTGNSKADSQTQASSTPSSNTKAIGVVAADKPSFKPLAPVDKQQLTKGGTGTQYDSTHAAYTYNDQVLGSKISVTQMLAPSNYTSAQDAADKTAVKLMADVKLPNKFGTAHIITKDPDGNQDVIAPVNGILVLIQSPTPQSVDQWKSYIESLQ